VRIFIETPIAFPDQHVATTAAAFLTAGIIEGVVSAKHYPMELVRPLDWKKAFGLSKSKDLARSRAIRLYPEAPLALVKHHNRAEALLIAKYGHDRTA
jgi:crossover junction endodeoxyribonuclease RuvC